MAVSVAELMTISVLEGGRDDTIFAGGEFSTLLLPTGHGNACGRKSVTVDQVLGGRRPDQRSIRRAIGRRHRKIRSEFGYDGD